MNEKFFSLPPQKQQAILNAGYRVFSQNSYQKSPMSEIAAEAGISKALLFHYFYNKRELYLYLWEYCAQVTIQYLTKYNCYQQQDLFESMLRGMRAKMEIIRQYPYMASFTIKAFYEKDPAICAGDLCRCSGQLSQVLQFQSKQYPAESGSRSVRPRSGYPDDVSGYVLGRRGLPLGDGSAERCGCGSDGAGPRRDGVWR